MVEFHKSKQGVPLYGHDGLYEVIPIEYKRGQPKQDNIDEIQLTAQAICIEEMLNYQDNITYGYLFYGETMHRTKVIFTKELRNQVIETFEEMHDLYRKRYVPKVKRKKSCNACSLKEICLPVILKNSSVDNYIQKYITGGEAE